MKTLTLGILALSIILGGCSESSTEKNAASTWDDTPRLTDEQILQIGKHVKSRVAPSVFERTVSLSSCGITAKMFDAELSSKILDQALVELLARSDLEKKTAENFIVVSAMHSMEALIRHNNLDQNNTEKVKVYSYAFYKNSCSSL